MLKSTTLDRSAAGYRWILHSICLWRHLARWSRDGLVSFMSQYYDHFLPFLWRSICKMTSLTCYDAGRVGVPGRRHSDASSLHRQPQGGAANGDESHIPIVVSLSFGFPSRSLPNVFRFSALRLQIFILRTEDQQFSNYSITSNDLPMQRIN